MKKMLVFIILVAVLCSAAVVGKLVFDANYVMAYYYERGEAFDTGVARGYNWYPTGDKMIYSKRELKELAESGIRVSWQVINGIDGLGFTFTDNLAMLVPGVGVDDKITDHYYLTF